MERRVRLGRWSWLQQVGTCWLHQRQVGVVCLKQACELGGGVHQHDQQHARVQTWEGLAQVSWDPKKIRNRTWEVPWDPVPERDYWAQDLGTSEHSQDTKEGLAQSITSAITRCHLSWHVVTMKRVTRGVMLDCEEPAISAMTYVCRQSSLHIVRTPPSVTTSHVLCHIIHLQNCGLLDKMMLIYLKILLTYISVRPFSHFRLCPPVFPWILCWDESSSTSYHKNQNHQRSHFRRIDSDLQVSCLFLLRKTAYLTY